MSRLLIYLSFFSLPSAQELELLFLTGAYFTIVAAVFLIKVGFGSLDRISTSTSIYFGAILIFLPVNFLIARYSGINAIVWLSRSIHLLLIPMFFICFKEDKIDPKTIFIDMAIAGAIEVALIYFSYAIGENAAQTNRAADIEGVILYSVFLLVSAFYCLRKFESDNKFLFLFGYLAIVFASILTGTRGLMISIALLPLSLKQYRRSLAIYVIALAAVGPLAALGLFDRFLLADDENFITVASKFDELELLWELFVDNPLLGAGMGKAYHVMHSIYEYTYSHNIIFFYLGYAGIVGLAIGTYPLMRIFLMRGYRILIIATIVFYTSSTSYTNVKHSIFLAFLLILLERHKLSMEEKSMRKDVAKDLSCNPKTARLG